MNKTEKLGKWRSLIAEQKESGQSAANSCTGSDHRGTIGVPVFFLVRIVVLVHLPLAVDRTKIVRITNRVPAQPELLKGGIGGALAPMVRVEVVAVEDEAALLNGKNQVGLSRVIKGRHRNFRVGLVIERGSSFVPRRIEEEFVDQSCERQLVIELEKGIENRDDAAGLDIALFDGAHAGWVTILVEFTLPSHFAILVVDRGLHAVQMQLGSPFVLEKEIEIKKLG